MTREQISSALQPAMRPGVGPENFRGVHNVSSRAPPTTFPGAPPDPFSPNERAKKKPSGTTPANIEFGFAGTLLRRRDHLTLLEEYVRFVEIPSGRGEGQVMLIHMPAVNTLEQNIDAAIRAAGGGGRRRRTWYCWAPALVRSPKPARLYDDSKAFCDGTDLATMLFPPGPLWASNASTPRPSRSHPRTARRRVPTSWPQGRGRAPPWQAFAPVWNRLSDRSSSRCNHSEHVPYPCHHGGPAGHRHLAPNSYSSTAPHHAVAHAGR